MTTRVVSYSPPSLGGPGCTASFDGVTFLSFTNTGLPATLASGYYQWGAEVMPLVGDSLSTGTGIGYDIGSRIRFSSDPQPFSPLSYTYTETRDVSVDRPGTRRVSILGYFQRTSAPVADTWYRVDRASKWYPGYKPVGTVLGSGTMTVLGATVAWQIKVAPDATTTIDDFQMPMLDLHYAVTAGTIGAGAVKFDILDDRGNWINVASTNTTGVAGITGMAAPQGKAQPFGEAATRPGVSPVGFCPTHFSFRLSTDALGSGTLVPTTPFLYLNPDGPELSGQPTQWPAEVGFDVSVDAYTPAVQVEGDTPGADGPGVPPVGVTPSPGGVTVTTPEGPVFVPLPGGTPNGPIILRIDNGVLTIIYDGRVIYVYELTPEDFSGLTTSGSYVGVWDPLAGTVTVDPGYPAVYPPLGGWRYRMHARERQPLGLAPRLFYAWATRWQGVSVAYWPGEDRADILEDYPQEYETDPDVVIYRGGFEWEIDAATATAVARAGGLAWLTEVPAPTP